MDFNEKQEGIIILSISGVLLIALISLVTIAIIYQIPSIVVAAGSTLLGTLCGVLIPRGLSMFFNPDLDPEFQFHRPIVVPKTNHDMGSNPHILRLPVSAKNGSIKDVKAELTEITPSPDSQHEYIHDNQFDFRKGTTTLFWADKYEPHSNVLHHELRTPKQVLEHMVTHHLSAAKPIDKLDERDEGSENSNEVSGDAPYDDEKDTEASEYINLMLKIEGISETFIADAVGTAGGDCSDALEYCSDDTLTEDYRCAEGEFVCVIKVSGDEVTSQFIRVVVRTGPNVSDLERVSDKPELVDS
jgi:hypothetical protein